MADLLEHIGDLPQVVNQKDADFFEIEGTDGALNPTSNKESRAQLKASMAGSGAVPEMVETRIGASIGARDFETNHPYKKNQLVLYAGGLYRAKNAFTSAAAFNLIDWDKLPEPLWGEIGGTLSDQADLQDELDLKLDREKDYENGVKSLFAHEEPGGGYFQEDNRDDSETFIGGNTDAESGIKAKIFTKNRNTNIGSRILATLSKIFYTKGKTSEAVADGDELAVLADVSAEAEARATADTTLQENIDAEAEARENADGALQEDIGALAQQVETLEGLGGPIDAHDFGSAAPTDEELTRYACEDIWGAGGVWAWDAAEPWNSTYTIGGVTRKAEEIFSSTWVRNIYNALYHDETEARAKLEARFGAGGVFTWDAADPPQSTYVIDEQTHYLIEIAEPYTLNHRWVLTNTPDTDPRVFSWQNAGQDVVAVANETLPGVVRSGPDVRVNPVTGDMSVPALAEKLDIRQGNAAAGKAMIVGENGDLAPAFPELLADGAATDDAIGERQVDGTETPSAVSWPDGLKAKLAAWLQSLFDNVRWLAAAKLDIRQDAADEGKAMVIGSDGTLAPGVSGKVDSVDGVEPEEDTKNVKLSWVYDTEAEYEADKDNIPEGARVVKLWEFPADGGFVAVPDYANAIIGIVNLGPITQSGEWGSGTYTATETGWIELVVGAVESGGGIGNLRLFINNLGIILGSHSYGTWDGRTWLFPVKQGDVFRFTGPNPSTFNLMVNMLPVRF